VVEGFVLQPRFLKEIKAAGFVKDNLVPNDGLQHLIGGRVLEPLHLPVQPSGD